MCMCAMVRRVKHLDNGPTFMLVQGKGVIFLFFLLHVCNGPKQHRSKLATYNQANERISMIKHKENKERT